MRPATIPDALLHGSLARFSEAPTLRGYLGQLYAISFWTAIPWLRKLRQPTLVLNGTTTRSSPSSTADPAPLHPGRPAAHHGRRRSPVPVGATRRDRATRRRLPAQANPARPIHRRPIDPTHRDVDLQPTFRYSIDFEESDDSHRVSTPADLLDLVGTPLGVRTGTRSPRIGSTCSRTPPGITNGSTSTRSGPRPARSAPRSRTGT